MCADIRVIEFCQQIIDRRRVHQLAERLDRHAADHRVFVIEERQDGTDRLRAADGVDHAQFQGDDFILLRVL